MRVIPLGADSLGVRSMATYVETEGLRLLLDPGVSLAPRRYGLPPTAEEEAELGRTRDRIEAYAGRAAVVTVSHYHADHAGAEPLLYAGRHVLAKDPRRMTDAHQGAQGREFWRAMAPHCRLEVGEGREIEARGTRIRVSPPFPHGAEGGGFGFVLAVTIDDGQRFVHAADLQGPVSAVATAYLVRERPHLVYVSGPPTYLEAQVGRESIDRGVANLRRLIGETGCQVILDHHAVREPRFRERLAAAFETGRVVTAAEYLGRRDRCLEARRPWLWARQRRAPGHPAEERGGR
jgi:hypothetical protein